MFVKQSKMRANAIIVLRSKELDALHTAVEPYTIKIVEDTNLLVHPAGSSNDSDKCSSIQRF